MHMAPFGAAPRFKPSLRVEALSGDVLMLINERVRTVVESEAVVQVARLLDGSRSVDGIIAALEGALDAAEVVRVLDWLAGKGHLCGPADDAAAPAQAFWELMRADGAAALANLAALTVSIECVGGMEAGRLAQTLAACGIPVVEEGRIRIVLTDDCLRPELAGCAARAAAAGVALLPVRPTGVSPTIGPLIHPQFGSCLGCLQFWLRANRPVEALVARLGGGQACHLPPAIGAAAEQAVYGLAASCISALFALREDRVPLRDHLLALDLGGMESARHAVARRPQCPACGDPHLMRRQAETFPEPQPVPGLLVKDGGYRKRDPIQTYERYKHLVSRVCGPVAYLHTMPRRHSGMRKVYVAGYLVCPQDVPRGNVFDKICAGKGQTDEQARASALCEALERFSGVYQGDEACLRGSMASLAERGEVALDFGALQNFSDWQYERRGSINSQTADRRRQVPLRFTPDSVVDWTPAWSLATREKRHVPLAYCYAETPPGCGGEYGIHNPNGAAAGNCLEEAILQGFLELVERDATAIWWYNQVALPGIDLASFADPYFDRLQADYAAIGWNLWVLDLTHDLGIAVCAALAHHPGEGRYAIGFGCHLDPHLAVQRALTEVNQLFDPAGGSPAPWDQSKLGDTDFLFPAPGQPMRRAGSMPKAGGMDLRDDIAHCVSLVARHGMDLLVVNKTRPDIGLSVAQVIVPGLRHFWPRFGEGRLYSVPVAMGWLPRAKDECELNPAPLFL